MKLVHLSDLHLGKRIYEYSLQEDQRYILKCILKVIDEEKADGVIIAGDIYDKSAPSADAVSIFDEFLSDLARRGLKVFAISGNHDSPERIAYGGRIMESKGIYLSKVYSGNVEPVILNDDHGELYIYMLPFIKPVNVRTAFDDESISTYTEAVERAIKQMNVDSSKRNVLITHQFVTGASRSDSETVSVGGSDNVDAGVFADFDYVALGHLHSPQNCSSPNIRYCGTPLKYSFSEANDKKSVTVVELLEKGDLSYKTVDLIPKHDMVQLKGKYEELTRRSYYENTTWQEDFVHITLTDEEDVPDAIGKLRAVYHRIVKLDYDNARTHSNAEISGALEVENKSPLELFAELYHLQNNQPMSGEQESYIKKLIEEIWEDEQ